MIDEQQAQGEPDDEQRQVEGQEQEQEQAREQEQPQPQPQEPATEDAATDELRERMVQMREEADRIASLGTGDDQVEAAERFAEDAGRLDEQIGAAARDADDDRSS